MSSTSVPSVKVPTISVKKPKAKKMPDAFGKPSLFFKKEDFEGVKQPSIENLRVFLEATRAKK